MRDLNNMTVMITGASAGFGMVTAKMLVEQGANVVLGARRVDRLQTLSEELGEENVAFQAMDVSNKDQVHALAQLGIEKFKKIDALVNNAGIMPLSLLSAGRTDEWDEMIDINIKGVLYGIDAVLQHMLDKDDGIIINISSVVGLVGNAGQANYASAKAGLIGLTKATAKELASRNITVNCIAPGYIATDMTNQMDDQTKDLLISQIPLGHIGSPDDIAATALFLASDEAGYITGQIITVDGGMVMI